MKLLATFKHISSKNADYGAAEAYLTFEHDEFTMKPTLDENGRLVPREGYRLATLNCGEEDFAVACLRSNLRYGKNQKREDVKSHHYIISFDPRDGTDNGLTVDKAQSLGEEFCNEHFPGHQAIVCTHPDGHNHSGNMLINRFLDNHPELSHCQRSEFADDGYTGTNFHRPQFTQMMEKVKRGEINLICVKDFSRFSRDYIETGNYLECTFPFMGVRFISINDGYDSDDYKGTTGGLEVVMRSIIYAAYSKDLSVKTTSAKIQMMKQGKYVGGYAPYGYVLHPTIRNKLAVDPEAADVIRRIFREALEGSNTSQIARSLNDEGIPTPGQYFKSKHPDKKKFSNMSEKISWETVMVYNILKNLVYTGTLVSRKMKSCGVGSKKRVVNEPIIVEGTHEAIVSKEDFELAQKVIRGGGRNPTRKQHDYPLKGLVRCGNCKRAMTRRKNKAGIRYFQCIHSVNNGNTDCPIGRSFPEMDIEKVVFHAIAQFLALAQKEAVQNREVGDLRKSAIKECADKIRILQKQNEQHKASKLRLYEKYAAGSITKEAYIQQKTATDTKIAENDEAIQRSHERMKELDSETSCSDEKLDAVCDQYADCKALTYELTHAFISAVYIYDLDNIEIVWKFKDFLTTSEGEAK